MPTEPLQEYLESRLRDNPKSLLFARLADLYLELGKPEDALVLCAEGVKHHPNYTTGYFVMAKAHIRKKELDKAEAALKKVLSHDQQYLAAQKLLADLLVKTGWEDAAAQHYAAVLDADPFEEKVRELIKRYASRPAPKSSPGASAAKGQPARTARRETEPDTPPGAGFPPEPALFPDPAPPDPPPSLQPPEPVFTQPLRPEHGPDLDWTDQIREFNPDDFHSPEPAAVSPAPEPAPGPVMRPPALENDFDVIFGDDASREVPRTGVPETGFSDSAGAGPPAAEPGPTAPPREAVEVPQAYTAPAETPAVPVSAARTPADEIIDFTQDWFDLSTFENVEESKPGAEGAEPPRISEAEPEPPAKTGPADLFERKEPREFLQPSDLFAPPSEAEPSQPPELDTSFVFASEPETANEPAETPESPKTAKGKKADRGTDPKVAPGSKSGSEAKPADAPAPQAESGSAAAPAPVPEGKTEPRIVTTTMGEIYAIQGQYEKAIQVYQALLEKSPGEQRFIDKIAELRKKLKESSGK